MTFLENKTIKAPTLYKTDNASAKKLRTALEALISERASLMQQRVTAEERAKALPSEIDELNQELSQSLDKDERESLKESITALKGEQEEAREVTAVDIKQVMIEKFVASDVYKLEEKAKVENQKWFAEINVYYNQLDKAYRESINQLANIRDFNIYKTSKSKLDDFERYLRKK